MTNPRDALAPGRQRGELPSSWHPRRSAERPPHRRHKLIRRARLLEQRGRPELDGEALRVLKADQSREENERRHRGGTPQGGEPVERWQIMERAVGHDRGVAPAGENVDCLRRGSTRSTRQSRRDGAPRTAQ